MKNTNRSKLLTTIKYFKPKLYKKMIFTGRLYEFLIRKIEINPDKMTFNIKDYAEAAYLCNIGFLALDEFLYLENFNKSNSFELIKEHVSRSVDYLENNKFEEVAKIVKLHHELPNGMGYFKIQNQDKLIAYLNIADEYIDLTIDYYKNTPLQIGSTASKIVLNKYKNSTLIQKDELTEIEEDLNLFYGRYILNV
jgi:response regulator RpfG family c-di-GMP phosphodiesterase